MLFGLDDLLFGLLPSKVQTGCLVVFVLVAGLLVVVFYPLD